MHRFEEIPSESATVVMTSLFGIMALYSDVQEYSLPSCLWAILPGVKTVSTLRISFFVGPQEIEGPDDPAFQSVSIHG